MLKQFVHWKYKIQITIVEKHIMCKYYGGIQIRFKYATEVLLHSGQINIRKTEGTQQEKKKKASLRYGIWGDIGKIAFTYRWGKKRIWDVTAVYNVTRKRKMIYRDDPFLWGYSEYTNKITEKTIKILEKYQVIAFPRCFGTCNDFKRRQSEPKLLLSHGNHTIKMQ